MPHLTLGEVCRSPAVRRDGVHEVSVRTVADEASTSPGALRHYFATQDELLGFALRAVVDRASAGSQGSP